ncbi:MAG: cobaltochelatase subunit CobN [Synechococcus sp.]|nr:cobaltochelatase subunit CobN [Synechococcus sp.]
MHRLAALPGDPGDGDAVLVEQSPAPLLLLSSADSDLALVSQRLQAAPQRDQWPAMRALNLASLSHPAAVDHYLRTSLKTTRLVLVRLLGGRGHWSYGLEQLRHWAAAGLNRTLVVMSGTADGAADLASLSSLDPALALQLGRCLEEGGGDNLDAVLAWCTAWLAGEQPPAPEPLPLPDPQPFDWRHDPGPRVGVVLYRALLSSGDLALAEACAEALRDQGLCPRVLMVSGLRSEALQRAVQHLFAREQVEAVLCGTGFASVKADAAAAGAPLWRELGVPVLQLLSSTGPRQRWEQSSVGLSPLDLAMQVALPELDGRLTTRIGSFKELSQADAALQCAIQRYRPDPEAISWCAELTARWIRLRRTPVTQRRVAVVLANYPTRNARLANGVGLDTPASAVLLLQWLQDEGVDLGAVALPGSTQELIATLTGGRTPDAESWHLACADHLPLERYQRWWQSLEPEARACLEERWGPPEQDPSLEAEGFPITAALWGHVVVLLQPSRGYDRDPSLSYHSPDLPPTHAYLAHYLWLREQFGAHVVVHLGKHGNLEWLPGKGIGQSSGCFPQLALGPMPNLYPFIVNDPGEGSQAKRRSQALILDHLTPPLGRAGLHGPLAQLEGLLDEYWEAQQLGSGRAAVLEQHLQQQLDGLDLPCGGDTLLERLDGVDGYLCELKEAQIRTGLHIYGQQPEAAAELELLLALARAPGGARLGLTRALADDLGLSFDPWAGDESERLSQHDHAQLSRLRAEACGAPLRLVGDGITLLEEQALALLANPQLPAPGPLSAAELQQVRLELQPRLQACATAEREHLLAALAGERVEAGPSGAPTRGRPDVLPTGRNFYAVDLRGVPTEAAWDLGWRASEALLEQHLQQEGEHLKHLALSIWGTSTMRSGGDDVAQVLALLGVRPRWDGPSRRMVGLELIPDGQLGRPRVAVTVRISGFFRDAFPQLIDWLNQADALVRNHRGSSVAACAIYGSAPGAYGAGLQGLIDSGAWENRADLAEAFLNWSQWSYQQGADPSVDRAGLEQRLSSVQLVLHNQDNREHDVLDSDDYYQFQGGLSAAVERISGARPSLWHGDHSRPQRPRPRPLQQELDRVMRSRMLNPRWLEGMQRHGYKGGFELAASLDYLFAYDACTDLVPDWAYREICSQWLQNPALQAFLRQHNPWALRDMAERLLEAHHRGLWQQPAEGQLPALQQLVLSSEEQIETAALG